MGSRVEQFEQIRRDRDREGLSVRGLAVRHGVHRRTVKRALASPVPPVKRAPVGRPAPKLGAYRLVIDSWLVADREAPRKQRHTARRIHRRLVDEHGADVAETTVRQYVRARKRAMGWAVSEVFVPQIRGQPVKELGDAALLNVSDGLTVDASRAPIGAHQLPRALQHVLPIDLVEERVKPSPGIGLSRPVKRSLQFSDLVLLGGPSHDVALTGPSLCVTHETK
jgi:hypothetical protein